MTSRRTRPPRREAQYVRGVGSLVALLAFIAGIPTLLVAVQARFWPDHVPSRAEVWDRLVSQDDGTILLGVLAAVAWIGWGVFTLIIATEIVGQLRGRQLPDLPGLAGPQAWAAALVAAVLVLLSTHTAAPAAHAEQRQPVPTLTHHPDQPPDCETAGGSPGGVPADDVPSGTAHGLTPPAGRAPAQADRPGLPRYTVARHDTLWGIAERHLGEGTRWRDILAVNPRLADPDHLEPGWVLVLPADAVDLPDSDNPPAGAGRVVTARPGDTLWSLAKAHLGDPTQYTRLFDTNVGRVQPDGGALSDPDLIRPGWQLLIPDPPATPPTDPDTSPPSKPPAPPAPAPPAPAPPAPDPPSPSVPSTPTPSPSAPDSSDPAEPAPTIPTGTGTDEGGQSQPAAEPADRPDGGVRLPGGGWLALSVAGAVATALAVARLRRVHSTANASPDVADDDHDEPDGSGALSEVEPVVAVSLEQAWLQAVALARTEADPDDDDADREWAVGARAAVGVLAPVTGMSGIRIGPPRPVEQPRLGSVPVGLDARGREASVVLSAVGGLGVTGPGAAGVARAVLLALLSRGRGHAEVICTAHAAQVLFGDSYDQVLAGVAGVRVEATLDQAIGAAEEAVVSRGRLLAAASAEDMAGYRADPVLGQIPTTVLVTGHPDTGLRARRMATLCELGVEQDITALVLGDWPAGVTCHVDLDGAVTESTAHTDSPLAEGRVLFTATTDEAARLVADVLAEVRGALDHLAPEPRSNPTTDTDQPPPQDHDHQVQDDREHQADDRGGRDEPVGDQPAADEDPVGWPAPDEQVPSPSHGGPAVVASPESVADRRYVVAVAVLGGPLRMYADLGHDDPAHSVEVTPRLRPKLAEVTAFLACHPDGATAEAIIAAVWPGHTRGRGNLQTTISELRRTLDQATATESGSGMVVVFTGQVYRLDERLVDLDYRHLAAALCEHAAATDPHARTAAARRVGELYVGELLDGADLRWAEPLRQTVRSQVAAALADWADHLAADNHTTQAAQVAERLVEIEPHTEEHYRRAMRLHAETGRADLVRRLYRLLESRLADIDAGMSAETNRLFAYLNRQLGQHRTGEN